MLQAKLLEVYFIQAKWLTLLGCCSYTGLPEGSKLAATAVTYLAALFLSFPFLFLFSVMMLAVRHRESPQVTQMEIVAQPESTPLPFPAPLSAMQMPLTRDLCPAAPLGCSLMSPSRRNHVYSQASGLNQFLTLSCLFSDFSSAEPQQDHTQRESALFPQNSVSSSGPRGPSHLPDSFPLRFPTHARHPCSSIVITAIIFTYQPRNGNWYYYTRQGPNQGSEVP